MYDSMPRLLTPKQPQIAPGLDRFEMVDNGLRSGLPDGFNMEWVFDRYRHDAPLVEGRG